MPCTFQAEGCECLWPFRGSVLRQAALSRRRCEMPWGEVHASREAQLQLQFFAISCYFLLSCLFTRLHASKFKLSQAHGHIWTLDTIQNQGLPCLWRDILIILWCSQAFSKPFILLYDKTNKRTKRGYVRRWPFDTKLLEHEVKFAVLHITSLIFVDSCQFCDAVWDCLSIILGWQRNFTKGKPGYNVETCCIPIFCPENLCVNETKWVDKGDVGLLGSTPEECCEERLCATHTCREPGKSKKLDIWESPGVARKESTDAECCEPLFCKDFVCAPNDTYGLRPGAENLRGSDRGTCCDVLKCDTFICPNNTKWKPKPGALVGSTKEQCCQKLTCDKYKCSKDSLRLLVNPGKRLGSTDDECCETKSCKDWKCSDPTKWVHRAEQNAMTNTDRKGWSDDECCDKLICLPETCDPATQWKPKPNDGTLQGSTFEQCCDPIFCGEFVCDTDRNKTGKGTQWYKKVDTNTYKWQGSTNEECCVTLHCSQYTTSHDTRWKRKEDPSLLGSTDVECYDPRLCSDYCCAGESKMLVPNAHKHQGSTDKECCIEKSWQAEILGYIERWMQRIKRKICKSGVRKTDWRAGNPWKKLCFIIVYLVLIEVAAARIRLRCRHMFN